MKIGPQNYDRMRAWFSHLAPEIFPGSNAVKELDRIAASSASNARKGLAMAIGDIVDFPNDLPRERVDALDGQLSKEGLPTLSEMRVQFSKDVRRVVRRGQIRDEVEYYAVRNAVETAEEDEAKLWALLDAYEQTAQD